MKGKWEGMGKLFLETFELAPEHHGLHPGCIVVSGCRLTWFRGCQRREGRGSPMFERLRFDSVPPSILSGKALN